MKKIRTKPFEKLRVGDVFAAKGSPQIFQVVSIVGWTASDGYLLDVIVPNKDTEGTVSFEKGSPDVEIINP